jgi:hypothetical protein
MGLELANFRVDDKGKQASIFYFDVIFTGSFHQPEFVYRADGVLFDRGEVRINRELDLAEAVAGAGLDARVFLDQLLDWVERQSRPRAPGLLGTGVHPARSRGL